MNKYNEVEIQTAKNLLKEGYKWIARTFQGSVGAFSCKPCKKGGCWFYPSNLACITGKTVVISGKFTPLFQSIKWEDNEPTYIEDIINPQILDDDEKRYLEGVIRPFMGKVLYITKRSVISDSTIEYISIQLAGDEYICLPRFKKGTMYKGAEPDHRYTLEELGL